MSKRYTPDDLLAAIDWEGGVDELIRYGIKSAAVPSEVAALWNSAEKFLDKFDEVADQITDILEKKRSVT